MSLIISSSLSVTSCGSDDCTPTEVKLDPQDNDPQIQELVVTASATSAYLGDAITLSATLDGVAVTSGVTYYVDDVVIFGNTISSDKATDLLVSAKYQNITSEYISVSFAENPFLTIEGEGNFIYNGATYEINAGYIELFRISSRRNRWRNYCMGTIWLEWK